MYADYPALKNSMSSLEIDVALCDFGAAVGCYEAAIATDTPYIVTEAFAMTSGMFRAFFDLIHQN